MSDNPRARFQALLRDLQYDVDLWIEPVPDNFPRTEQALSALEAQWGETETKRHERRSKET